MVSQEYRKHFPFGIFADAGQQCTVRAVDGIATPLNINTALGVKGMVRHPDVGVKATGLQYIGWTNQQPYSQETLADLSGTIEAEVKGGKVWQLCAPMSKPLVENDSGWDNGWFHTAYDPEFHTQAAADAIAANYAPIYEDHPSVLAFNLRDDAAPDMRSVLAVRAMQNATGIPTACMWPSGAPEADLGDDLHLLLTYHYPCGHHADGSVTPTAEGDFHRSTFSIYGDGDWVDRLRWALTDHPDDVPAWLMLQAHDTTTGEPPSSRLRYPTSRELRKQVWVAIGEGFKGLFWFAWSEQSGQWDGLCNPSRAADMTVASEMAHRITPEIRRVLLRSKKYKVNGTITELFTTSGGGATYASPATENYASAYVATLYDANRDEYSCVVCNHATTTESVTISSATLDGKLVNMETGEEYWLPATVSLPALDGAIFRHDPAYGVPMTDPDLGVDVETWLSTHWAVEQIPGKSASPNYRAAILLHPDVQMVTTNDDLQDAIDAVPDGTTLRLAAGGTYEGTIRMVGRERIHIISDNPANKAAMRRVEIFGSAQALAYDGAVIDGDYHNGFNVRLGTPADPNHDAAFLAWENPKRDFLFQQIDFESDGDLLYYNWYGNGSGGWKHDHRAVNMPVFLRNVRDVLFETCTFSGYQMGADPANPDTTGEVEVVPVTPGINTHHDGFISGNSGLTNIIARDCVFNGDTDVGYPWCFFLDGARGSGTINCDMTGRYRQGLVLFLTNDDYTGDWDNSTDGGIGLSLDHQQRNCRFCFVIGGDILTTASSPFIQFTGFSNAVLAPNVLNGNGNVAFIEFVGRGSRDALKNKGHRYHHLYNVVRGVTAPNGADFPQFVRHNGGSTGVAQPTPHNLLGQTTIADNVVAGTVTAWHGTLAGSWGSDGGDVATNNTDVGGARDGV